MKIVLSSNPYRDKGLRAAQEARRILEHAGAQTVMCLPFQPKKGDRLDLPRKITLSVLEEELPKADLLICFGGDGTILHAARDATLHNVPILGVNMGSVGFMAELERGELPLLAPLAHGMYSIEERMMLDVKVLRGDKVISQDLALNDAVISKGSMARVAEMEVFADRIKVTSITGDGIIVATPTGSTAYSMSAGGPIVEPTSKSIIVTPVCAHQLAARAMVLAPERVVTVQLPRGNRKYLYLSVDGGKALRLSGGDRVEICRGARCTQLLRLADRSFYQVINQKLGGLTP
ncbi:MAG: NAD(+)/NADH kinase [Lawsonibacter sp.]|nr:NAD(+)/NADH kinase [Lawsonibacter sp.]